METMNDLINQIVKKYGLTDENGTVIDNKVAGILGISRQLVGQLKTGRVKHVGEKTAYRVAVLLNLNPAYVLLVLATERAKTADVRRVWESMMKTVTKTAAAILVGSVLLSSSQIAGQTMRSLYIMSNFIKRLLERLKSGIATA